MKKKRYGNIIDAIKDNLVADSEDARQLIYRLRHVKKRGYLTRKEFIDVCHWKSARPLKHYQKNDELTVKRITREALATSHEKTRITRLTRLRGVKIPTASAILAMSYPNKYGVIDIRVWKCFYKYGLVNDNPKGRSFSPEQWYKYLVKLRYIAKKLKKSCRIIEFTIFNYHKEMIQRGKLYN